MSSDTINGSSLALIGTRHLGRDLFLGSFLLRVVLTGPPAVPSREAPVVIRGCRAPAGGCCLHPALATWPGCTSA